MKRFLIIAVVGLMATAELAKAQVIPNTSTNVTGKNTGYMVSAPTHSIIDTAVNAVNKVQLLTLTGYQASLVVQPLFSKISGTVAGSAQLQGSIDGVVWANIGSAYTLTDVASQNTTFDVGISKYQKYRLSVTGSGTMAVKIQTPWLARTPN